MGDGVQSGSFSGAGSLGGAGSFRGPSSYSGAGSFTGLGATGARASEGAPYMSPSGSVARTIDSQSRASGAPSGSVYDSHGAAPFGDNSPYGAPYGAESGSTAEQLGTGPRFEDSDDDRSPGFWNSAKATAGDVFDGAVYGGFTKNESGAALTGQIATGLIPIVGQVADTRDTVAAWEKFERGDKGSGLGLGLALAGWIPLAGDLFKNVGGVVGRKALPILERSGGSILDGSGIGSAVTRGFSWLEKHAAAAVETVAGEISNLKSKWFYKPTVEATDLLPPGEGQTDAIGNVLISSLGSREERELVYHHEMVHQFLSPKFLPLLEFRASARMSLYQNSSLCRYVEEALAESYAQLRVNGWSGVATGLKFPIANGYVELKDVVTEAAVGTVAVGGASYGVYVTLD